ncbi:MAG TPA: alkaline phosphatase family protein [Candidatus Competibacter sp.]|nr:alkaline phosphatase family protein [Candidatus Competibacter sp.]
MYKITKNIIIIIASILMLSMVYPISASDYPNLIIMGWDGAGLHDVKLLIEQDRLPNLKRLIQQQEGITLIPTPLHGRTRTVPMWTEFFTGLTWDQTGSFGNEKLVSHKSLVELKKFDAENHVYSGVDFWVMEFPSEWCFVSDFKKLGYTIGWFTSKKLVSNDCNYSPLCHCAELADTNLIVAPDVINPDSYLFSLTDAAVDFTFNTTHPFLIFLHVNPDHFGHYYGENSARYFEEFERADHVLGQLIDLMTGTDTKFLVVADHGFDENKTIHRNAPDSWMAGNIPFDRAYWLSTP